MRRLPLDGRLIPVLGIPLVIAMLLAIGVLFVHSASAGPEDPFPSPLARAHLMRVLIGLAIFGAVALSDYRLGERFAPFLYIGGLGLLAGILAIKWSTGAPVVRWFKFGGSSLQPSELVKLFAILLLARILKNGLMHERRVPLLACLAVVGIPFLMVRAQPDLGTALVFLPIAAAMLWVAGISVRTVGSLGLTAMVTAVFFMNEYQKDRVMVFLGRAGEDAASGDAYHVTHSMISIGSGGPTGKGYGLGTHHNLGYLPEDHNDFIFGVIGEEWGLVGTIGVLLLFLTLFLLCLRVAWTTREPFGRFLVVGVTAQLAFQTMVNLGMTCGLAPVTGLPLPFISYGGTSMFIVMMGIGMVVAVAMRPVESLHPNGLKAGSADRSAIRRLNVRRRVRSLH